MVALLKDRAKHSQALAVCAEINWLDNEADQVHRQALACLFAENVDAFEVIKHKDLYAFLEEATDRCEDVANVIESIVIKAS